MHWKKLIVRNLPFDATRAEAVGLCGYPLPAPIDTNAPLSEPSLKEVQAACPAFYRFEAGKPTKNGMPAMPARLYLHFRKDPDELLKVLAALNGKAVESSNGVAAVLEAAVAPNQKLPREKRRRDNKVNTYERDPEFVVFLEELENPTAPEPMVADGDDAEAKPVPALVKFLNERRSKAKLRSASTMTFGRNGKSQKPSKAAQKGKSKKTSSTDMMDVNAAADTTKTGQRKQRERRRKDRAPVVDEPKPELQPGMFRIMPKAAPVASAPAPPLPPPLPASLNAASMTFEMPPAPTDEGGRGGRGRSRSGRGKKPKPEGGRGGGDGGSHPRGNGGRGDSNGNGGRGDGNGGRGDGNGGRGDGNGGRGQSRRSNKGPKTAPPLPTS